MVTEVRLSQVAALATEPNTKVVSNVAERKRFIAPVFLRIAYSISARPRFLQQIET